MPFNEIPNFVPNFALNYSLPLEISNFLFGQLKTKIFSLANLYPKFDTTRYLYQCIPNLAQILNFLIKSLISYTAKTEIEYI